MIQAFRSSRSQTLPLPQPYMPDSSLSISLQCLRSAVAALPKTTPVARPSGIVYRNFKVTPQNLTGDVWLATSNAYTRCFTDNPNLGAGKHPRDNILQGKFGMDCVIDYFEGFKELPEVSSSSLFLVEQLVRRIADLVYEK